MPRKLETTFFTTFFCSDLISMENARKKLYRYFSIFIFLMHIYDKYGKNLKKMKEIIFKLFLFKKLKNLILFSYNLGKKVLFCCAIWILLFIF